LQAYESLNREYVTKLEEKEEEIESLKVMNEEHYVNSLNSRLKAKIINLRLTKSPFDDALSTRIEDESEIGTNE
jgi:hypothetical protein